MRFLVKTAGAMSNDVDGNIDQARSWIDVEWVEAAAQTTDPVVDALIKKIGEVVEALDRRKAN